MTAPEQPRDNATELWRFTARVLIVLLIVSLALFAWAIIDVLLLAFGGVLVGVFVRRLANFLGRILPISRRWTLVITVLLLFTVSAFAVWLLGSHVAAAFTDLANQLPQAFEQFRNWLFQYEWMRFLRRRAEDVARDGLDGVGSIFTQITGVASTATGVLANAVVLLFIGLYFAADPHLYREGVLQLVPHRHRDRVRQTMTATGDALWHWLLGQLISMITIGVLTAIGLLLLGVPAALALGAVAGILEFVPVIGPILAAIPAVLIAFAQEPMLAVWVALLYVAIQQVEGNVVMPLVQHRVASLPPVLALTAIMAFGLLFGFLGVLLATPLAVAALVWIKRLYVADILERQKRVEAEEMLPDP
jgi:predicted PurR-regulated permease PerM